MTEAARSADGEGTSMDLDEDTEPQE